MRARTYVKITSLALSAYGAYTLWNRYGRKLPFGLGGSAGTTDHRVTARAELTVEEASVGSDDPVAQATAILADSDERALLSRDDDGIERRRSEDTVEP